MDDLDFGATIKGFAAGQQVFNRYSLKKVLGRGGMGVVWLAHDDELERDVALKFLPEVVAMDKEAIRDLKRETRRSLELTHYHIVRIYDFIQDARSAAISMEYVAGDTLAARKLDHAAGCFSIGELEPWVRQLGEALTYAHTRVEVVHRDLKPANLMIDARGDLKITDFGIAASVSDSVSRVSAQAGSSGTPLYMSPQQMMGEKPAVTDDVYALGATLYELLTGKPPFYSGNIIAQVQAKVPPSIAVRRAELEAPALDIPVTWEETVAACLAKDAAARPQSVAEVMQRLGLASATPAPVKVVDKAATVTATQPVPVMPPMPETAPPPRESPPVRPALLASALIAAVGSGTLLAGAGLGLMRQWYYSDLNFRVYEYPVLAAWIALSIALAAWSMRGRLARNTWLGLGVGFFLVGGGLIELAEYMPLEPRGEVTWYGDRVQYLPRQFVVLGATLAGMLLGGLVWLLLRGPLQSARLRLNRESAAGSLFGLLAAAVALLVPLPGVRLAYQNVGFSAWLVVGTLITLWLWRVLVLSRQLPAGKTAPSGPVLAGAWSAVTVTLLVVALFGLSQFWKMGAIYWPTEWETMAQAVESVVLFVWLAGSLLLAGMVMHTGLARLRLAGYGVIAFMGGWIYREFHHPPGWEYTADYELIQTHNGTYGMPWLLAAGLLVAGWMCWRGLRRYDWRTLTGDVLVAAIAGALGSVVQYYPLHSSSEARDASPVWFSLAVIMLLSLGWQLLGVLKLGRNERR